MDREIKVIKCDEQISISFSPEELVHLKFVFKARALEAEDYYEKNNERKLHEAFAIAREIWEKRCGKGEKGER